MKKEENHLKTWSEVYKNTDQFLIQLTLALTVIGLIFAVTSSTYESYRLTNSFWTLGVKQRITLVVGLFILILLWLGNFKSFYKITWPFSITILIIMLITKIPHIGITSGGSQRWIDIGLFQFQPAELAKLAFILLLSKFLTKHKWYEFNSYHYLGFSLILILVILKQPDLGSAGILVLLFLQMLLLFGWPLWLLFGVLVLAILSAYFCSQTFLSGYQLDRIKFWINPYLEPQGRGYNLIQAKYAFALGGILGAGLGNSIQKQGYLPIPHSDFIFAVIAEEIGCIGVTAILILYLSWVLRGLYVVNKVKDAYGRILGTAIILLISTQAAINIAVTTGLLPVTGVTLPFFSCGGTSLIMTLALCGILFNIISKN